MGAYEIKATPTPTGEDVTITATEGYAIDVGGEYVRELTINVERAAIPHRGSRYMLDGKLIKVIDWHRDESGAIWVTTDAGESVRWRS